MWADEGERGSIVLDDEIGAWANGLATDRLLLIVDACHSGTVSRDGEGLAAAPKEVRYEDVAPSLDASDRPAGRRQPADLLAPTALRHTLHAAARDAEVALSGLPGDPILITGAMSNALPEANPDIGLAHLMRSVRRLVQAQYRRYRSEHTPQFGDRAQTISDVFSAR